MSNAAQDRLLRPIYDALDTGSNKSAIVACNKFLKKQPKNDAVKALKALALVRCQKVDEASALCDEVMSHKPTEESVLSAMMHVLRGLGRNQDVIRMFENASKAQPSNEDLVNQTFFANVRTKDWKVCQQLASKMLKTFQDNRYVYWHAICAVLQAEEPTTPSAMRPVLFKLAHRLLSSNPKLSFMSADRFYLHLSILKELELWDEAQEMLSSEHGKAICNTSLVCDSLRRDISRKRGLWLEEGEVAQNRLIEAKDRNWLEFLSVLDATFSYIGPTDTEPGKDKCREHITKTRQIFTQIADSDGTKDRSGPLALIELEWRARSHGLSEGPEALLTLMESYFGSFGDKACCFEDLKPYLQLDSDSLSKWTKFLQAVPTSCGTISDMRRTINVHKLLRHDLSESEMSAESELQRADLYVKQYLESLRLGDGLAETELQPADDLAILAAEVYVNLWSTTHELRPLYAAVAVLEFASLRSKQCYQIHLLLVRIYRILGAPSLAVEHYRAIGIKQVQTDTLSHELLSRASIFSLSSTGDLTFTSECLEASQIYASNTQETGEFVVRAFTAEKYSVLSDFLAFQDRLEDSLQRELIKLELIRLRVFHEPIHSDLVDAELVELKYNFDKHYRDNRDFSIIPNYQAQCSASITKQTELFGSSTGGGWLRLMLKIYVSTFTDASDLSEEVEEKLIIGDRPKPVNHPESGLSYGERLARRDPEELSQLGPEELQLLDFATTLGEWLRPWHDHARPPPAQVLAEAAKQNEAKTGRPLHGVDLASLQNGATNGHKKDIDPPVVKDAPPQLAQFFVDIKARFDELVKAAALPYQILHLMTLAQEGMVLFTTATMRFKNPAVIKMHRLGALAQSIKDVRTGINSTVREMGTALVDMSSREGRAEDRKEFVDSCRSIIELGMDEDMILGFAKKVTENRKKLLEGVGKGVEKLCSMHSS